MAIVKTDNQNYTDIANAIRSKGISRDFKPNQMAAAIASIPTGSGVDVLLYTDQAPKFSNRYPSSTPVIYCPLVANWNEIFSTGSGITPSYTDVTLRSDIPATSINGSFRAYNGTQNSSLETVTIDIADLSSCTNYSYFLANHLNFKELKGTPLDFSSVTNVNNSAWCRNLGNNVAIGVNARYKANTLHVDHNISTVEFTYDTIVSIANGLQRGAHTITLHTDMKTICQSITGAVFQVTDGGTTYDFFTADASGTATLEYFITQIKGWTIA